MPHKDPEKAREYRNKWARDRYAEDAEWREARKAERRERGRIKYQTDPAWRTHVIAQQAKARKDPTVKAKRREYQRQYMKEYDIRKVMLQSSRRRAKSQGIRHTLKLEDIQIPAICPVLGILLVRGRGLASDQSPSLDRIDPKAGYVPGNVAVISYRANRVKNDGTLAEHLAIVRFMREHA